MRKSKPDFQSADLRPLQAAEVPRACGVLTEAFARDPFYTYIMGDAGHDPRISTFFHLFTLNYGLKYGMVFAPGPAIQGIAIWLPPGRTHMTGLRSLAAAVSSIRGGGLPRLPGGRGVLGRLARYGTFAGKIHERHAPLPHWYLMVLGVADAHRGQGFAGRLLRPVLRFLDERGLSCYLETHNPANPPIYGHFGFKTMESAALPGSDFRHWAMLRPPDCGGRS